MLTMWTWEADLVKYCELMIFHPQGAISYIRHMNYHEIWCLFLTTQALNGKYMETVRPTLPTACTVVPQPQLAAANQQRYSAITCSLLRI